MSISAFVFETTEGYQLTGSIALEQAIDNSDVKIVYILADYVSDDYFSSVVAYEYEPLTISGQGQTVSFNHEFTAEASWNPETVKGYVMVQNFANNDGEIFQAAEAGTGAVSATALDFGDSYIGSNFTKEFSVFNVGTETANIEVNMTGDAFSITGDMTYTLEPGTSQSHTVQFVPTAEQAYSGTIDITTDITMFENNTVIITGNGFVDNAPSIANLALEGTLMNKFSVEVSYNFVDIDNDGQGESQYTWYESEDQENWTEYVNINANYNKINISDDLVGKYLRFVAEPVDEHGMPGQVATVETDQPIADLAAPTNLSLDIADGNNITLNWTAPELPEIRGLFGYKVMRGAEIVTTIMDTEETSYTDENVADGQYTYAVKSIYAPGGLSGNSNEITVLVENGQATVGNDQSTVPVASISNGPNPFSNSTNIFFQTRKSAQVKVDIYNVKGQLVNSVLNQEINAGEHTITWNGNDSNGNRCSAGVYFYKVTSPEKSVTKKMILMK